MKILFSAPDRDLLECYKNIFDSDFGECAVAFDGTHVVSMLAKEMFDIMVLDCNIPRIDYKYLIGRAQNNGIPVVLLVDEPVNSYLLCDNPLPDAYVSYPFTPEEIESVIKKTIEYRNSEDQVNVKDICISLKEFSLNGNQKLTMDEIETMQLLIKEAPIQFEKYACVSSLNRKLVNAGSVVKIKYKKVKGFELVTENE